MPALPCPDEATVVAFLEGHLAPGAIADVDAHLQSCAACRDLVAAVAPAVLAEGSRLVAMGQTRAADVPEREAPRGPLARGAAVGRYVILGLVGRGGMGDVYAAYDPELDRKVALKLLNDRVSATDSRAGSRGRLLREAKAIARLSHPNVVVVHDAGTFDDRVFIAMEFVEGKTLAEVLGGRPRPWPELRTVFLAAGRGLAAAHAARVVHRDFKPQNVMVTDDGEVRVMDFGLASDAARDDDGGPVAVAATATEHADFSETVGVVLTHTGTMIGTPAYMAPEQFRAEAADPRSDQFSFCVALYEGLYGQRPFDGETIPALRDAVLGGHIEAPPAKSNVPSWLRRVLLRGLSVAPSARWPSMNALLAALGRDPARARRRSVGVVAAAALVVAGATGLFRLGKRNELLCRAGPSRLAGLWEEGGAGPRHEAVRAAFLKTGLPYAAETWERTAVLLDRYAAGWLGMHRDACERTHVRGEQSVEVLDLRMTCLDERLAGFGALVGVLASADQDVVSHAVDASGALPPLARCADVKLLRAPVEPPKDEATRARVEELRRRAATTDALHNTGKDQQALEEARRLLADARAIGYRPLIAELLERVGHYGYWATYGKEVVHDLESSVWAALAARRDEVAAEAAALLTGFVGYSQARSEEGERWAEIANAILERLGEGHDQIRSWVLQNQADIRERANELDTALALTRQALALKEKVLPADSPDIAHSLITEAFVLHRLGHHDEAIRVNDRAKDLYTRAYGPGSPMLAIVLNNGGDYLVAVGRFDEALPLYRDAFARWEAQLGPESLYLGHPLTGLGLAHLGAHRVNEAIGPLERALRIREAHEPDTIVVAETRFALARALWESARDRPRARRLAEQARDAYAGERARGKETQEVSAWLSAHLLRVL